MEFEVLINQELAQNQSLFSVINDFEDGQWRIERFNDTVWDNVALTALTFKERQALIGNPRTLLRESAKKLRLISDDATGSASEVAEIILYAIMEHYYKALSVVPKIFYKQNVNDNAKGADSVHIVIEDKDNEEVSIWFGECKFFNSFKSERHAEIIDSVIQSLNTDKLKKERILN